MSGFIRFNFLVKAKKSEVHRSPVQFYSDNRLNVHIHLTEQIQYDEWGFHVERIVDRGGTDRLLKLEIKWLGLEEHHCG
jgi:hypothetical protein